MGEGSRAQGMGLREPRASFKKGATYPAGSPAEPSNLNSTKEKAEIKMSFLLSQALYGY